MTKPTIIFATLADHPLHRYTENNALRSLVPGDLVAVELPPNCAIDATTSEVQYMLSQVEERLRVRHQDWSAADAVARVRTLLGAPRDGEREAFERVAKSAAAMLAHFEWVGTTRDDQPLMDNLRDALKAVRATEGK